MRMFSWSSPCRRMHLAVKTFILKNICKDGRKINSLQNNSDLLHERNYVDILIYKLFSFPYNGYLTKTKTCLYLDTADYGY